MRTHDCEAAGRTDIALRPEVQQKLHARCPGAYRTPEGELQRCDCPCHGEGGINAEAYERAKKKRLNVIRPDVPVPTDETDERPSVASKGTSRRGSTPAGRCEHCGAPCRGRFVVGHDAKLKSELTRAARGGSAPAVAELIVRDWWRLVKENTVPESAIEQGWHLARAHGEEIVITHNATRASRAGH